MIITTTPTVEGRPIATYHAVVTGEAIMGANLFKDFFASISDVVGGRSGAYEKVLKQARQEALEELEYYANHYGADAVVGVDLDYEVIGKDGSMLMVSATGTAVSFAAESTRKASPAGSASEATPTPTPTPPKSPWR
ncbi:uncharacterized protein YbjQ (UPF0145 family) [Pacificimonas flava]|uniref:UPF0145 protein C725_0735 n=1 Tax=Pacificimonas flava TaxID=1234595 RepID=M2U6Z2_9SPHN|nr:hypothetical protein C725_0735 [Pacificimonas flava]MBB5280555.1 uncharacterized protein YbjQ (UPF0145 family) [Pacificimonas flava]